MMEFHFNFIHYPKKEEPQAKRQVEAEVEQEAEEVKYKKIFLWNQNHKKVVSQERKTRFSVRTKIGLFIRRYRLRPTGIFVR